VSLDPSNDPAVAAETARLSRAAFIVGMLALAGGIAYGTSHPDEFFRSYLLGFMFWNGLAVGSLAVLMLQYLTGGAWGISIRRELEAATRTLPWTALAFVPIAFGMHSLYEWTHADVVAHDELLQKKAAYLNAPFFLVRAALAFAVWILIMLALNRWSREQDGRADHKAIDRKLQLLSGGGLVAWALTTTWTSVDWVMSLEPHWFSTMYGVIFMAGQGLGAISLATFAVVRLAHVRPISEFLGGRHMHDLGKMMFAFTMFWAYVTFSQYLIVWSGNLPEEISWYLARFRGGWGYVGFAVLILQFVLPFLLLLSRRANRNPRLLSIAAALVIFMRFVDLAWMILPAFSRGHFRIHPTDLTVPIAIGGLWLGVYFRNLAARPLLPVHDPGFEEALAHGRD
jgi:hypothetical protein